MKKLTLLFLAFFLAFKGFTGVQSYDFSVYFPSNSFALSDESKQILESILKDIPKGSEFEIYIQGHTDDIGTNGFNEVLSKNRAEAVKSYFIDKGLNASLINMEYYGELDPARPNTTNENREENRRVSVQLTTIYFNNIEDLENTLKDRTTTSVTIDPNRQNVVTGKDGTKILIDPNSFVDANGHPITEEITIELTEALNYDAFISHNLATLSGGKLLVSGGMFQINATTGSGQPVQLNQDKNMTVTVPAATQQEGMELFTSDQGENWDQTGQSVSSQIGLDLPDYPKFIYHAEKLPRFIPDSSSFPKKPRLHKMPKPLKMPSESDYKVNVKWYQFLWAGKIEREAHERYLDAMRRYDKKRRIYDRRVELYKRDKTSLIQNMADYNKAVIDWRIGFTADSTDFYLDPTYVSIANDNKIRLELAQAKFDKEVAAWKTVKIDKIEDRAKKMQALGLVDRDLVDSYVMTVSDLKWVNIDRFYNLAPKDAVSIKVKDPDKSNEKVFLVFTEMKSMLSLHKNDNNAYVAKNIPANERKAVFAYKVENGKAYVSYQTVSKKSESYSLKFKPSTFKELRALLKELNA